MASIHFFIEPSGISNQTSSQKFGPISGNEFRITSSFSVNGTPAAFAACQGRVLIQPQTGNPGIVNLILKPVLQPLRGLPIKYMIYRGLSESAFFEVVGSQQVVISATGASDLIAKIRTEFSNFHAIGQTPEPPFLATYIGYDPNTSGAKLIDELFFKDSDWTSQNGQNQFELPMIAKGASIGSFSGT